MIFLLLIYGLPVLATVWWLWADRSVRKLKHARPWRIALACWFALMFGGYLWLLMSRRFHMGVLPPVVLQSAVYLWHLLVVPMTVGAAILVGIGVSAVRGLRMLRRVATAPSRATEPVTVPTRRDILGAAMAALPPLVTAGFVGVALPQLSRFRVRQIDVPVAGLPPVLDGMTIAHVSDVHVGKYTRGRVLDDIVATTNALDADLVVMTGDLIDWSMRDLPAGLEMIKALRGKGGAGAILCEGNHDLFDDRLGFERGVKNAGVPLLLNESYMTTVRGRRVQLLGIKWGGLTIDRRNASIEQHVEAVARLRTDTAFPILLAHHPHAFDPAAAAGFPLTLAGHSHGGQLMLGRELGAGPMLFKYWSGLYQKESGASLVVSNGVGNWFPLRVGAPAEIVKLTLKRNDGA
jgi:uncharacterized protein